MAAIPFDTLKRARQFREGAGFTPEHAAAAAEALAEALASGVTGDISGLKADATVLKSDMNLMKWMVGFLLALQIAIALRVFIH